MEQVLTTKIRKVDITHSGNYYGVFSGYEVEVFTAPNTWHTYKVEGDGIRGKVNCLVKVLDDKSAIVIY